MATAQETSLRTGTLRSPSGPKIWLQDNRPLTVQHVPAALNGGVSFGSLGGLRSSQPVSMAQGDVDADGYGDLVVGYRSASGGYISILRGNINAFAPQNQESFQAIARGEFPSPFLSQAATFAIPVSPDFIALGDFAGHGNQDLIVATRGSNVLYLFAGDGKGKFAAPLKVLVSGGVTALAAGPFGTVHGTTLMVGLKGGADGNALAVFGATAHGLSQLFLNRIDGPASSIVLGAISGGPQQDAALVADGKVIVLHSATMKLETLSLPVSASAIALGSFIFDRYQGLQIAVLGSDGSLQIAVHGQFDPRPYTAQEQMLVRRASMQHKPNPLLQPMISTDWRIADVVPNAASSDALQSPVLFRARVSNHGADDVVLLNAAPGYYMVLSHPDPEPGATTFAPGALSIKPYTGSPVAGLPMRLNVDGRPGIVALHSGDIAPSIIMPTPDPTYFVNTFNDPTPVSPILIACNNTSFSDTTSSCSLREAVLKSNGDTIMLQNGVYQLTIGRGATQDYSGNTGALYVNASTTFVGTSQTGTVIEWGTPSSGTVDTVMAVNEDINSPFTNATASLSNLTIEGAVNNGTFSGLDGFGGGMMFDTGLSGNNTLTLTNVTILNNSTTDGDGGGLALFNTNAGSGSATFSNSTIQGNSANESSTGGSGLGGGIYLGYSANMSMTGTTVAANLTQQTNAAYHGQGGGIYITGSGSAIAIHSSTISSNVAAGVGGGLYSTGGVSIDMGTTIYGNISHQDGGGLWYNAPNPASASLTKVTVTGNSADGNGGGIRVDDEPTNSVTMSYSRFSGNSAGTAGSNLSVDAGTVTATDNWWGSNAPAGSISELGGTTTFDPFIVLTNTASPQVIRINQSTTLTANMSLDDDGNGAALSGNLDEIVGLPATFYNPMLGTIPQTQPETLNSSAQAFASFQSDGTSSSISQFGTADLNLDSAIIPVNSNLIASASEAGNTVTITTVGAHGFSSGEYVLISGVGVSGYNTPANELTLITGTPSATTFTYTDASSGLATSSGGTANAGIEILGPPSITTSFSPTVIQPISGSGTTVSTLTFSITNGNAIPIDASFTDSLPANLLVAAAPDVTNNCGGSVTAPPGTGPISFSNAALAPGTCTITVNVQSAVDNTYNNSVTIDSTIAGNGITSLATLTVINPPHIIKAFGAASMPAGATTSLTFTVSNPNQNETLSSINFTDSFPFGLVVATPNGVSNTCSGTFTATAGSGLASLSGTALAPGASCMASVNVQSASVAVENNAVTVSDLTAGTGNTSIASITITQPATTTAVTSSSNPSVSGQLVTFTATVSPVGVPGTPTGTVTFLDGGGPIGSGTLSGGVATFSTTALIVGNHTITTSYGGDGTFTGSTGSLSGNPQVVIKANSATVLTSSANPSVSGQSVTFTATVSPVSPGSGTSTGTVTFLDGGSPIGSGTLVNGVATFTTTSLAVGNHTITSSYGGDGNFNGDTGSLTGNPQVVIKDNTTSTVTSLPNPTVFGQSVTFTATVSASAPGTGTPTGTVTFLDGGSPIGSGTLTGGVATFTTSALAVGGHTITTSYGGDGSFNGDTGSLIGNPQVVSPANTISGVTSSLNPSVFGQLVTFTATLSAIAPGAGTPTGLVTFLDGGSPIGSGTLSGGIATFSTSGLAAGGHVITTSYAGDGNFNGSIGTLNTNPQAVFSANTSTMVTSSQNPQAFGQPVTFTATVSAIAPASGTPTGLVTFLDGGSPIGSGTLSGGVATFTTSSLSVGNHTITASYSGATNFVGSNGSLTGNPQVINSPATTTTLTAAPGTITLGDTVTLTATVTSGSGTPAGLVTFYDGTTPLGSAVLSSGVGQFTTALLSASGSPHSITATYQGSASFDPSTSSTQPETVNLRATTVAVALNPTTVVTGQASTSTVTVSDGGSSTPPGTPDNFASTGGPITGRSGFTSTLIGDGMVMIAGGTNASNSVLASAEIYSVSGASFTATGSLNTARTGAVAVLLPNGKVLVAGGSSDGTATGALNSAELFDPSTGVFTATSQSMTVARLGASAVLLSNGKVLLVGGENSGGVLNSSELYDPIANTFTVSGNLNAARTGHVAVLLATGKVLVSGGSSDGTPNGALNSAELFDPAGNGGAGAFTAVTSTMTDARWQPEIALLLSGKVLIAGGQDSGGALNSADLYDPVANSFSASAGQMALARSNSTAVALPNGMVLLAGGAATALGVDLYDADSDKFDSTGALQAADNGLVSTQLNNGQVLVIGLTSGGTPISDAELYSPTFNPLGIVGITSSEATDNITGTCTLTPSSTSASDCTSTVTAVNVATSPHTITGSYSADVVHGASSNTGSLNVLQANTATLVASSANPSVFGQAVTFTATVSAVAPGSGTPTGTVTFLDGGSPIGSGTLTGGVATFTTSALAVGNHTITTSYSGDGNYNGSTGSLIGNPQVVTKANSIAIVTSSNNPDVFGQSVTFTATIGAAAPGAGTATGTVTFLDGGSAIGTGTLSGGAASFTTSALAVGNHTITTSYTGDGNFNGGTGSLTGNPQVVTKANSITTVTSSASPTVFGQSVTFTATVSAVAPGAGTPTATVTFLDGGTPIGTGTLTNGVATFTTSTLAVGNHTITASYAGDGNFNGSTGSLTGNPQVVTKASSATTVTSSANPTVFGQSVTFTATVSAIAPGAGTPTTTVTFLDGGTPIGTGTLTGGVATFTTSALAVGNHTITASYAGDGNFNGSTGSLTGNPLVVNKANSATTVTSSANASVFGQSITFTATVSAVAPGAGTPTTTVTFLDGGTPIGTGTLTGGIATFTTSALAVGNHTITASYGGDGNFNGSTGSLTGNPQVVNKANSTTAATSALNPSIFGQPVTFTATIAPAAPGAGTATGTVTFLDGGSPIGTGTLTGGVATFTASGLSVGNHTITASYGGDGNFNSSTGSLAGNPQVVNKANSVTVATSSKNPSILGQPVSFTASISAVAPGAGTPTGTVTFLDGGGSIGTGTLSGGIATFTTSTLGAGNHTITTSYTGDGNFNGSTGSLTGNPQVVVGPPAVMATFNPATINVAGTSVLMITISNPAANTAALSGVAISDALPAGLTVASATTSACGGTLTTTAPTTIQFAGGTIAANGLCQLSIPVNGAAEGNYVDTTAPVTATNGGTGNTATASITVKPIITIAPASLAAAQVGVSYSATFDASGGLTSYTYGITGGALPAGLSLSTAGLLSGTPTAGGSFNFTVTATDSLHFTGSQTYSLTVTPPTITVSPSSLPTGTALAPYSQTLVASGGTPSYSYVVSAGSLPSGLTLSAGGVLSGTPAVGGTFNFTVQVTDSSTGTGPYSTTTSYTLTINLATTTLAFGAPPSVAYGAAPFAVKATSNSPAAITYTISGPASIGTTTGIVTLSGAGSVTVSASQPATATYTSSSAQTTFIAAKQNSITTLTASATNITPIQSVTLTATVTPAILGTPTGNVSFFDGTTLLGTTNLSGGVATFTASALAPGLTHTLSATYNGDVNFNLSNATSPVNVIVAPLDFTMTITGPSSQTVIPSSSISYQVTVTPLYGTYAGTVNFAISGLPPGATATFSPASIAANGGPQTVTVTITTAAATAMRNASPPLGRRLEPFALAFLLLFGAGALRKRRRALRNLLYVGILCVGSAAAIFSLSGCGGHNGYFDQAPQNYSVTITATAGSLQHTATVTLNVQ
ncbi:MAG: Ig-like domain repeat protein [Terracidiphilus sp.]